ncbi:hypothetical protein PsorP6_015269 [Peronosclerospora sorghi]|uniref:Uncharacterized protein n=1 Tax=Peronosclerospora sorghi TaxID=230839 RepID=A0ACC0VRH6_9STRA|nr:hypothetical protein PsorP6_015269 [Peronosclerospora sorghi]
MAKGKHTTRAEYQAMITWLENKANVALITGAAAQAQRLTSGQKLRKAFAQYVNRKVPDTEWEEKAGKKVATSLIWRHTRKPVRSRTLPASGSSMLIVAQTGTQSTPSSISCVQSLIEWAICLGTDRT